MSFSGLTFASPLWLWGLWIVPALVGLFFWAERQAERKLALLMRSPRLRAQLTGAASPGRRRWRYGLMLLGLMGLLFAMAGPRLGYEAQPIRRKGVDLILMADVSKSMLATDLTPNRITRAKLAAQDLISQLQSDRVGLVAFAGSAFLQAPLTVDYDAALTALRDLDTDTIPRGGTNLEAAINLAIEAFGKAEADNRAIVLFSDGEATEGESANGIKAAARAAEAGIRIFTVGLGTAEGAVIPLPGGNGEFVRDRSGQMVRSKLDEDGLDKIAKTAGGFYVHLQNGQADMRAIAEKGIGQMKTGEIDAKLSRRPIERYQWPLGAGLLSLGLAALIGERRKARAPASGVAAGVAAVPSARRAAVAALGAMLGFIGLFGYAQADQAPPSKDPMALYRDGRYDEAYQGFKNLAKTNPDADRLHFDAGASAYMGGKYDDALNAFGEAMTSKSPDLQAMSHYNFGNTLYKRGAAQKDRQVKIQDWRNAVEHYDNALNLLKTNKNEPLAADTTYNRDLVSKMLEEELKPQPTPPPQQKQDQKQDQKQSKSKQDQKDQQKQDQKQDQKDQKDQKDSQDQKKGGQQQQQQSDQQRQQQQSQSDQQGSAQPNKQNGNSNTPPKEQDPSGQSKEQKKDEQSPQGGKSDKQQPQNQPQKSSDQGQKSDSTPPPQSNEGSPSSSDSQPDPSSVPNQDQPRQRGDFKAQPGEKPSEEKGDQVAQALNESDKPEEGKMNAAQARALLEALKGEDDHVNLNDRADRREEPAINDW